MPTTAKESQQKLEHSIRSQAHDPGVRALHEWLKLKQGELAGKWYRLSGEELVQSQGYARAVTEVLRVIEQGPKIPVEQ